MIYLYGLLSLYDHISTWIIMTTFGVPDANPFANIVFASEGGWAFMLALKVFEILGMFAIIKLWKDYYNRRSANYVMTVLSGIALGVSVWNTYVFVRLCNG